MDNSIRSISGSRSLRKSSVSLQILTHRCPSNLLIFPRFLGSVIGPTGVGKSTFIDYVIVGEHISRDSRASTTGITVRKTDLGTPPQSFAFVDTPGFDNATNVGHILWFIKRAKKLGLQLDRTLYLHPVLEDPKSPSPEEKLHLTSSLYRTQLPEATFVEITWSLKRDIIGPRRVRDHLKGKGCDTVQFGNSIVSAHRIVLSLEESSTTTPLENPVSPSSNVQDMSTQLQDGTRQPQISAIDPPGESQNQIQGAQAIDTRKTTATSAGDVKSTEDRSSKPADTLDPFSTNIRDDTARNNQEVKAANQIQDITRGEDLRATDARKVYFTNTKDVEIMNEQDAKLADAGYMFVTNIQDDTARSNQEFKAANQTQDTTKEEDVRPTNTRKESVTKPNDVDIINDQSAKRANTRDPAATNTEGDEARNNHVAKSAMKTRIPKATQGKGPQVAERRDMSVTIQPTTPITVPEANIASLEDIPPTDKVFLIMGPDGSGKSTFIDYASGGDGKGIWHQLRYHTGTMTVTSVRFNSRKRDVVDTNKFKSETDNPQAADVGQDNAPFSIGADAGQHEDTAASEFDHPNNEQHNVAHPGQFNEAKFDKSRTSSRDQFISGHSDDIQPNGYGDDTERHENLATGQPGGDSSFTFSQSDNPPSNEQRHGTNARHNATSGESLSHAPENPNSSQYDPFQASKPYGATVRVVSDGPALPGPLTFPKENVTAPNTNRSSLSTINNPESSDHKERRSTSMKQSRGTNHENSNVPDVNTSHDRVLSNADEPTVAGLDESMEEHTIWFVETPGFDQTYKSDIEVLIMIAEFLIKARHNNLKLDTILYFHRIIDREMKGSVLKNLRMFASICGNVAMPNVVLVMTMWSLLPRRVIGKLRQEELENDFWISMLKEGCRVAEFGDSYESAHMIISGEKEISLSHPKKGQEGILLSIQLVDQGRKLGETEAGITLKQQLTQLIRDKKEANKRLKERGKQQNNPVLKKYVEAESERIERSIEDVSEKLRRLGYSFPTAYKRFLSSKSQVPEIPSW